MSGVTQQATPVCTVCRRLLPAPGDRQAVYRGKKFVRSICPWCFRMKQQINAAHNGDRYDLELSPELAGEREKRIRLYQARAEKKQPLFEKRRKKTAC